MADFFLAILLQMGAHLNNSSRTSETSVVPFVAHAAAFVLLAICLLRFSWPRPESSRVHPSSL